MKAWCRCLAPVFCHIYNCMHLMIFRNIYTLFPVFAFWHWHSIFFLFSKTLCHTPEKPVWGSHTCRSAFPYGLFRMPEKPFSCIWKGHIHWWYVQSANIQRVVNVAKIAHIAVLIGSGLIIRDSQRLYIVFIFTFFSNILLLEVSDVYARQSGRFCPYSGLFHTAHITFMHTYVS